MLVGITASRRKRRHLRRYLNAHWGFDVYVPDLPYRRPLGEVSIWYLDYLANVVKPERYDQLHGIAYIAGGTLLNQLMQGGTPLFERLVCFRGPYQELVAARLVQRIGQMLAGLVGGKSTLDLADDVPSGVPWRRLARHEALVVEEGRSRMARWLGIDSADIPPQAWSTERLLPSAEAVLRIQKSHDDVYTDDAVLAAALAFIEGRPFPTKLT